MSSEGEKEYICPILAIGQVTHDVKRFVVRKPEGYSFKPGQATELSLNDDEWRDQKRPFTFTSLNSDANLEFTIKSYPEHDGVTVRLHDLSIGDELVLGEPWGAITYQGPGLFIAGGAGITPFIAILRDLEAREELDGNVLLFSNKTSRDIILEGEFTRMLGKRARYTLTQESATSYDHGRVDRKKIEACGVDKSAPHYLCGPPSMVEELSSLLAEMGIETDSLIVEE